MNTQDIIASLDAEITRLQHARTLIANASGPKRRGRPLGSVNTNSKKRQGMSAAGRKRIAEAQRKRWAAQKKQKAVKVTRVPAKEAPKRRAGKPAAKSTTALFGNVPKQPVAAAKAKNRVDPEERDSNPLIALPGARECRPVPLRVKAQPLTRRSAALTQS